MSAHVRTAYAVLIESLDDLSQSLPTLGGAGKYLAIGQIAVYEQSQTLFVLIRNSAEPDFVTIFPTMDDPTRRWYAIQVTTDVDT